MHEVIAARHEDDLVPPGLIDVRVFLPQRDGLRRKALAVQRHAGVNQIGMLRRHGDILCLVPALAVSGDNHIVRPGDAILLHHAVEVIRSVLLLKGVALGHALAVVHPFVRLGPLVAHVVGVPAADEHLLSLLVRLGDVQNFPVARAGIAFQIAAQNLDAAIRPCALLGMAVGGEVAQGHGLTRGLRCGILGNVRVFRQRFHHRRVRYAPGQRPGRDGCIGAHGSSSLMLVFWVSTCS